MHGCITFFVLENHKRLAWQTVQTLVKCHIAFCGISSGSALFAKINFSSGIEIYHNLEISTCNPFKYIIDDPIPIVSIYLG